MRRVTRTVPAAALALAALAAGCASGDEKDPLILSRSSNSGGADVSSGSSSGGPPAFVVDQSTASMLEDWLSRPRTLIGDVVEADLSRKPMLGALSISLPREAGPDGKPIVERIDATDPKTGILSITLINRSGFQTLDALPTVRIGTGLTLVGTERVVLRVDGIQPETRPVWALCVAKGRARMVQTAPERRLKGDTIQMGAEVVRGARGYELRESENAR